MRWQSVGCIPRHGTSSPDQHVTVLIDREPLAFDEFLFQVVEARIVEVELAFERSIGQASTALEQDNGLVEEFVKRHTFLHLLLSRS